MNRPVGSTQEAYLADLHLAAEAFRAENFIHIATTRSVHGFVADFAVDLARVIASSYPYQKPEIEDQPDFPSVFRAVREPDHVGIVPIRKAMGDKFAYSPALTTDEAVRIYRLRSLASVAMPLRNETEDSFVSLALIAAER